MKPGLATCQLCGLHYKKPDGWSSKLCPACKEEEDRQKNRMRKCHDCGAPTYNYRCSKCWSKLKRERQICENVVDAVMEYKVWL